MHVVHESRRLLEIHSPAVVSWLQFVGIRNVSVTLCMLSAFCLVTSILYPEFPRPILDLIAAGVVCGVFGVLGVLASMDDRLACHMNLRFDGDSECLVVTRTLGNGSTKQVQRIPFSRIVRAEVFVEGDDDNFGYALRIVIGDPTEEIRTNDWLRNADAFELLADRINRFLESYRSNETNIVDLTEAERLRSAYN